MSLFRIRLTDSTHQGTDVLPVAKVVLQIPLCHAGRDALRPWHHGRRVFWWSSKAWKSHLDYWKSLDKHTHIYIYVHILYIHTLIKYIYIQGYIYMESPQLYDVIYIYSCIYIHRKSSDWWINPQYFADMAIKSDEPVGVSMVMAPQ